MNNHHTSDEILVELLKNDDEQAFEILYNRYWKQLFGYVCQQVESREETEEILHELMLGLWNNRKVTQIRNLKLYLYIAAKNQINRYIKLQIRVRKYKEFQTEQNFIENIDTDVLFNEDRLSNIIETVLNKVPEKTAIIFRMHKMEELPIKKIALEMGLTEKAVEYHITKSMKLMRSHLKDYNSDY
jgi:RNA polymerase sigma factor (sigma-70 family)